MTKREEAGVEEAVRVPRTELMLLAWEVEHRDWAGENAAEDLLDAIVRKLGSWLGVGEGLQGVEERLIELGLVAGLPESVEGR